MPVYQITGKNGKVYQIEGPANATREQIVKAVLERAPEAGVPPQEESFIESIPVVGGILGNIVDYPARAVEGLAGTTEAIVASTGAGTGVTDFFGDIAEGARGFRTRESRESEQARAIRSQLAEERGIGAELGAAVQNFLESPLESTAMVAGSAVPFVAAGLGAAAAAPATGGASIYLPLAAMGGVGVAAGLGGAKSEIYDASFEAAIEKGASDEQARAFAERAQAYGGKNLDQISLAGFLGGAAAATGFAPAIARTVGSRASALIAQRVAQREAAEAAGEEVARRSLVGGFVRGSAAEAIPEGIQAGQQRYAANLALQREGFDVDPWQGVAGAAAAEGLASILLGGYGGVRETNLDNIRATTKQFEKKVEDLPDNPTEKDEGELAQWAMRRGFSEEEARIIGRSAADKKRRVAQAKAETEAALREARETRLADVEPSAEPDITAPGMVREEQELTPPPVDLEEQAAMMRAYEAEMGGGARAPLTPETYVDRYMAGEGRGTSPEDLELQQFAANFPGEVEAEFARRAAGTTPTPSPTPTPSRRGPPQPMDLTPERAGTILSDPVALSDYEASGGDIEALYDIAEGTYEGPSVKYSRGRRPRDTATPDMFAGAPLQEAPGEAAKREELAAQRFATDEERLARQEQVAAEMEAGSERAAALRQREAEQREETLGDIEYALRAQAPENAVYKVLYEPEDTNAPYKLVAETQLGKKPEEVLSARTLQDFSDQVYGQMMELTPYIPEAPAAIQEIEQRETGEQVAPTAATRMIQEFTAEVDAAREAGQIDDSQRAQLLRRLERPNAYRPAPNGQRMIPNDAIAKLEKEAIDAASAAANAPADQRQELAAASKEANDKLRAAVKNSLLNPARAALKSMVEMRQDEKVGAKVRIKEAERAERAATRDMRKAMESGKGVLEADVTPEREQIQEAQKEKREAKIDLAQQRVQKYRKGERKGGMRTSAVQRVVDKITKQWKSTNPVVVVQSVDDIPDAKVRRAIKRDKATDAEGLVAPDGTVYLIADNLTDEARAKAVLFHEGLGHIGLEKLFREKLDDVLTTLYNSNAKLKADTDRWVADNPGAYENDPNPLARAVEEVLAERSEAGRIEPSLLRRIAAIVRNFARRLGIQMAFSDADVEAVLAAAHERTVDGPQESQLVKGMRYVGAEAQPKYSRKKADTKPADAKKVEEASERLSDGARKVQKSLSTQGMTNGLEEMVKGRSFKDWGGAIWSNWDLFSPGKQKKILKVVTTSGLLGWVKSDFKALHDKMAEVDERVQKMAALKNRILNASEDLAREIQDFADAHGTTDLFVVQAMARISEVAPDEFASAKEALQKNAVIVEIERKMLKNSNNKAETRKLIDEIKQLVMDNKDSVELKGDKFRMSGALTNKLRALERLSKDSKPTSNKVEQLAEMTRRIRDIYEAWDKLGQQKNGHKIYKEMRSFYKDMFEAELALLDERINLIADKDKAIRIKDMRAKLMREVVSPDERKKQGDLFYDIDADLFQKDYVPFMREGDLWLRVIADKRGTREREFHTFRTERELRQAQKEIAKRLGVDPEDSSVIVTGYDLAELQKHLRTEDEIMGRVFNIVSEARAKYEAEDKIDLKELADAVYQTWLMTTPERSVRRRLMHAEEVVGFSPDTFLHFRTQASTYANQLSKLAYAGQIRQGIEEAREVINDPERPTTERAKWNNFVSELESRAEDEINPQEQNRWVNALNRVAYFYYLTSARTALIQLATIPIRVVPRMWRDYGYAKGTAQWLKYLKLWKSLGRIKIEREKTRFGDRLDAFMPTVSGSEFVSNSADLQWAKRMGAERGILDTLQDTLVQNERATPGKTTTGLRRVAGDTMTNTAQLMGFLFKGMDNLSRQAAYYMTFELAVEKYRSENKPAKGETDKAFDERARQYALKKAVDMVRITVGDFSTWERPGLAKGNVARSALLFKMHALVQTQFMADAMRDMARGTAAALGKGPAEAKAEGLGALKELSGVLLMAGMFGGLMGMPLYSVMTYALMGAFGPDEEDDEDVRALMGGDPRTAYDPDIAFRSWMNDKFGDIKIGDASLADILTEGPISTALGVELASSTSLDIMNMWFRDPVVGDSTEDTILQTILANVAPLSMLGQISRGSDSFAEGNIRDGLRKMLPAFFRTGANAYYNETEGVKNRRGDTLIPKEEITVADNFKDVLGFRSPRLNRIQQYAITRAKNETAIKSERKGILDRFERAYTEGEIRSRADLDAFIKEEVIPFNRTYPAPEFLITEETLTDSLKRRAGIRARTIEGVQFDKKTLPQDLAAQRRFVQ